MDYEIVVSRPLSHLAELINEEHRAVERAANDALEHAFAAGHLLIEARAQCPKGKWMDRDGNGWLKDNFEGHFTTAYNYIKLAKNQPRLEGFINGLGVFGALGQLREWDRELARNQRELELEAQVQALDELPAVDRKFHVVVIDPPWPYGTKYDPSTRRAANPYPEMPLEDIAAIEIPAQDDCVLWLWTTHKFMRHSFDLLDGWRFRDVAILTWVKDRMGLGSWLRSQSEFCIMAVKGKPIINLTNQTTVISGPLREHSRKPDEFYEMVDELCTGAKIDYFSREFRDGWYQYGNETGKF